MKVVNVDNQILGRAASQIAAIAKEGEEVHVLNSEKIVVSGDKKEVLEDYKQKHDRGRRDRGPYFPKRPDKILKRTIKNMLPNGPDGREMRKNVKTYLGTPTQFEEEEITTLDVKTGEDLKNKNYTTLTEISEFLGSDFRGGQN